MHAIEAFKLKMAQRQGGGPQQVLLTGAKVWEGSVNPNHRAHYPSAEWHGTDVEGGEGVELVCDLHELHLHTEAKWDAIFSPATLEHLERPWVAVNSMGKVLKPGGVLFLHTHQTFPVHGYPSDYFRFSEQSLRTLCGDAGLEVVAAGYDNPCTIVPPPSVEVWNDLAEAYLNVNACAIKPG